MPPWIAVALHRPRGPAGPRGTAVRAPLGSTGGRPGAPPLLGRQAVPAEGLREFARAVQRQQERCLVVPSQRRQVALDEAQRFLCGHWSGEAANRPRTGAAGPVAFNHRAPRRGARVTPADAYGGRRRPGRWRRPQCCSASATCVCGRGSLQTAVERTLVGRPRSGSRGHEGGLQSLRCCFGPSQGCSWERPATVPSYSAGCV